MSAERRNRTLALAVGLTALLLILLIGLSGLLAWQSYRTSFAAAESRAANASEVVAAHMRWLIEASFQALRRIDGEVADRPAALRAGRNLDEAVAGLPKEVSAWVFDAEGRSIQINTGQASAVQTNAGHSRAGRGDADAAPGASIAGSDAFLALKGGAEWNVSPLAAGLTDERKVFLVSRRIEREHRFEGVASLTIPVDLLAEFWRSLDLGPGSSVGVLRDDGWLVARYPVPKETINLAGLPLFTAYLPVRASGTYVSERSPTDGLARVVGFYRLPNAPLVAVSGIPLDAVMSGLWRRAGIAAIFAVPVAALLLGACVWIYRLLARDERTRLALEGALEENRMLFREIHHRVKNNLQTVSSLIQLQPGTPDAKQAMARRIAAMTAVHEQLYGGDQFARLELKDYVTTLLERLRESQGPGVAVDARLQRMEIDTDIALPLGLIVNEVISNAFKHAFPEGRGGRIEIVLEAAGRGRARLTIGDNGVGFEVPKGGGVPERSGGMGSRLIRGLTVQIGGTFRYAFNGGTRFVLEFPQSRTQA